MEKIEYRGINVEVMQDEDPINYRKDEDIFTKMVCWHRRYELGDEQPTCDPKDYKTSRGCVELHITKDSRYKFLNLYLYDHSGITMNTSGFSCGWDSGCVGFIYMSIQSLRDVGYKIPKKANWKTIVDNPFYRENMKPRDILSQGFPNDKKVTLEDLAYRFMKHDVKRYDDYLTGNCYMYKINHDDFDDMWITGFTSEDIKFEYESVIDSFLDKKEVV